MRPPPCYRRHSSSDYCEACEGYAAFVAIPRLVGSIAELVSAVGELRRSIATLATAVDVIVKDSKRSST